MFDNMWWKLVDVLRRNGEDKVADELECALREEDDSEKKRDEGDYDLLFGGSLCE